MIARHELTADAVLATWSSYCRTPEIDGPSLDGDTGLRWANRRDEKVIGIGEIATVREELATMHVTEAEQVSCVRARVDAARGVPK